MSNNDRPPRPPMKLPPMTPHGYHEIPAEALPSKNLQELPTEPSISSAKVPPVEKPPPWAMSLGEELRAMRVTADGNHRVVMHAIDGLSGRVVVIEKWKSDQESRKYSGQIKRVSDTGMENTAAIGVLVADVGELKQALKVNTSETMAVKASLARNTEATMALKEALVDNVKGFIKENPQLVRAAVTFFATVFGTLTTYLAARGH